MKRNPLGHFGAKLIVALCIAVGCMATAASAQATPSTFENVGSGHCISDNGASAQSSPLYLVGCNGGTNNQVWVVSNAPAGGLNISNESNDLCLTNANGSNVAGNPQVESTCQTYSSTMNRTTYSAYAANDAGTEFHIETWTTSGGLSGLCLSSNGDSSVNAPLVIAACNDSANQTFIAPALANF